MNHSHELFDSDPRFRVDVVTRIISNASLTKLKLMQYDHNSERFTFEIPRYIEGHDLLSCNVVEVHYLNIESNTRNTKEGVYTVEDVAEKEGDSDMLVCSWIVSSNATQYVGQLSFLIRFSCVLDDGTIEYAWNTGIYSGITISSGIYNANAIEEDYGDVLNAWKKELKANQVVKLEQTQTGDTDGAENVWTATFGDGRTSDLTVKNGSRGLTGLVGSIETITGSRLNFFVGTKAEYDALSEKERAGGLFAIITDDDTAGANKLYYHRAHIRMLITSGNGLTTRGYANFYFDFTSTRSDQHPKTDFNFIWEEGTHYYKCVYESATDGVQHITSVTVARNPSIGYDITMKTADGKEYTGLNQNFDLADDYKIAELSST